MLVRVLETPHITDPYDACDEYASARCRGPFEMEQVHIAVSGAAEEGTPARYVIR